MANRFFRRGVAAALIAAQIAACTHMPSGEKAFKSFDECIGANLGLAAAGGIAIGALAAALTRQNTSHRRTANTVGVAAGIAATVMIGMVAWRKCAAVYSTSEVVAPPPPAPTPVPAGPARPAPRRSGLSIDRLNVKVEGNEETPPVPEFVFTYGDENASAKDIKAKLRHKVEIVRFKALDDDRLVLADARDNPLLDSAGKPIPLGQAMQMPRDQLHWVTIAEEGKDDYDEDVVIQQGTSGTYQHKLKIPPRQQLPLPLPVPMRYRLTVQIGELKASRQVDFAVLPAADRPRQYGATGASTQAQVATRQIASETSRTNAAAAVFKPTHLTTRAGSLYNQAKSPRKSVGSVSLKTPVRIEEETQVMVSNKSVKWVKVLTASGATGWLAAGWLKEIK